MFNESMSMTAWKCYTCNLTFTREVHAVIHKDLSKHNAQPIQIASS